MLSTKTVVHNRNTCRCFLDSHPATGHGQNLVRPPENHTLDYEGEVAIVIGKEGRRISKVNAYDHICVLTLCNEGTIRDWVRHAKFNVTQDKNWDKSGAIGPWLVIVLGNLWLRHCQAFFHCQMH